MPAPPFPEAQIKSPLVLLSQGEVRPGVKQGQHWGSAPQWTTSPPPAPPLSRNFYRPISSASTVHYHTAALPPPRKVNVNVEVR